METFWFVAVALMLTVYVVLDGFDLGAGIIHHVAAKTEAERRGILRAIGPVWDGNEVWLIAAGGTLFFSFPVLYAASFSGRTAYGEANGHIEVTGDVALQGRKKRAERLSVLVVMVLDRNAYPCGEGVLSESPFSRRCVVEFDVHHVKQVGRSGSVFVVLGAKMALDCLAAVSRDR